MNLKKCYVKQKKPDVWEHILYNLKVVISVIDGKIMVTWEGGVVLLTGKRSKRIFWDGRHILNIDWVMTAEIGTKSSGSIIMIWYAIFVNHTLK